ncbi:MAG: methyltransferase domain-containing protein [Ferruginibacter sp.]
MEPKAELYSGTYSNYGESLYRDIRKETFGEDMGQNSWLTAEEYRNIFSLLKLTPDKKVLEIATGSGGPAVIMVKETGCHLTGIDINKSGVINGKKLAKENAVDHQIVFLQADASEALPFKDESFDVVISIDSINHLMDRNKVLKEFKRVLRTGGQLLYIDPVVVTGILSNEEIAIRSSIGFFLFVPIGENERLLQEAGFKAIQSSNVTGNIIFVSIKWFNARESRKDDLIKIESEVNFNGLQKFFKMVHTLSSEGRLSRFMFIATK